MGFSFMGFCFMEFDSKPLRLQYVSLPSPKRKFHSVCMAIENVNLMHECCAEHFRLGKKMKKYKKTAEDGKRKRVNMKRSKGVMKQRDLEGLVA